MSNNNLEEKRDPRITGLAYGIWIVSAILSVLVFIAGREMVIRNYVRFFPGEAWKFQLGQGGISLVNVLVSFPLAMLVIAIMIGGFEYQYRNMGKPQAWQVLARTLAVELGILWLALYI